MVMVPDCMRQNGPTGPDEVCIGDTPYVDEAASRSPTTRLALISFTPDWIDDTSKSTVPQTVGDDARKGRCKVAVNIVPVPVVVLVELVIALEVVAVLVEEVCEV